MTLLICVFVAIIFTVKWYHGKNAGMMYGLPAIIFWGASLMWLGDAIFEYVEMGSEYFAPEAADMLNDAFLGLSVVALCLILWVVVLLIKDPKGIVRTTLLKKK